MGIKLYFTSVSSSRTIKSQQLDITRILDIKGIKYDIIDISVMDELKKEMKKKAGDPNALPPQVFNEDQYCGNFQMFQKAVEDGDVEQFLKL